MTQQHVPENQMRAGDLKKYQKPEMKRIELALEETLTAGCKGDGTECTDPFPGTVQAGS